MSERLPRQNTLSFAKSVGRVIVERWAVKGWSELPVAEEEDTVEAPVPFYAAPPPDFEDFPDGHGEVVPFPWRVKPTPEHGWERNEPPDIVA